MNAYAKRHRDVRISVRVIYTILICILLAVFAGYSFAGHSYLFLRCFYYCVLIIRSLLYATFCT